MLNQVVRYLGNLEEMVEAQKNKALHFEDTSHFEDSYNIGYESAIMDIKKILESEKLMISKSAKIIEGSK